MGTIHIPAVSRHAEGLRCYGVSPPAHTRLMLHPGTSDRPCVLFLQGSTPPTPVTVRRFTV